MQAPVVLPDCGIEPGTQQIVSYWFAKEGEEVIEGDRLVEILAGAMTFDVPSPGTGHLIELRKAEDDVVQAGDILGIIDFDEEMDGTHP